MAWIFGTLQSVNVDGKCVMDGCKKMALELEGYCSAIFLYVTEAFAKVCHVDD